MAEFLFKINGLRIRLVSKVRPSVSKVRFAVSKVRPSVSKVRRNADLPTAQRVASYFRHRPTASERTLDTLHEVGG